MHRISAALELSVKAELIKARLQGISTTIAGWDVSTIKANRLF
jgi:hypothetical protein